jgi:hypothetical protein
MLGVPKFSTPAYMLWQGDWVQKTYNGGMTVRDGDWTMVALTQTNDRAGPQAIGLEGYPYQGTMTPDANSAKHILYGQRYYNADSAIFVNGYKIDVIQDNHYEVYVVTGIETGIPVVTKINDFVASATEELKFSINQRAFRTGQVVDFIAKLDEPDPIPTQWNGDWNYTTPNNTGTPAIGDISQSNSNPESFRIHSIDDTPTNRYDELVLLTAGDKITIGSFVWTISNIVDNTTWFDFTVLPSQQTAPDGVTTVTFDTTTPSDITIGRDVDYWVSDTNIKGLFSIDGGYDDLVPDDNAYGILDILLQDSSVSDDWAVVSEGSSGANANAQLNSQEVDWVRASAKLLNVHVAQTVDNVWTEIDRIALPVDKAYKSESVIDAKRTDGMGFHAFEYSLVAWHDSGVQISGGIDMSRGSTAALSVQAVADNNDVVLQVRGQTTEHWDWTSLTFRREIG